MITPLASAEAKNASKCLEEKKTQGESDPTALHDLALSFYSEEDYTSALPLFQKCLEKRKEKLGEDHPDTLTTMNNLAGLYKSQGDYVLALPLYLKCLS